MPMEKFFVALEPTLPRPVRSSRSRTLSLGSARPSASAFIMRLSVALMEPYSPGDSMSAPMRRLALASRGCMPNSRTSPSVGATSPASILITVDLPAPLRPTNP